MKFPKLVTFTVYLVLAAAIIGGSLWLDTRRRNDERLTAAHLTYYRSCYCVVAIPPIQIDLFGDGTIILQSSSDSGGETYVAHVDPKVAKAYFAGLDDAADWHATHPIATIDGSSCSLYLVIDDVGYDGGCYTETREATGEISLTRDHPQVVRLEQLVGAAGLQAFDHDHLPAGITLYQPSARYPIHPLQRMPAPPAQ